MTYPRTNSPCKIIYLPIMLSLSHLKTICKHPRNLEIFLKKNLGKPKPKRDFTPLGRSYESTLKELLQRKLIVLPQKKSGFFFLSNYCAYHRHNLHKTSHCMELKNKIQDLFNNGIIQKSKLSSTRDSTLKKDQHYETNSSNGSNATSTSANMPSPTKEYNLSSMPPPNKAPNSSAIDYVYL